MAVSVALVLLLAALIAPAGLAKSHGSSALAASHHGGPWNGDGGHGHSHDGDAPAAAGGHAHHAGDHSHDHAHALPMALSAVSGASADWRPRTPLSMTSPSLGGLERPPPI